ncbi:MAG: hypothetical protein ACRDPW_00880, partial [Mycobacteriales bacterium]
VTWGDVVTRVTRSPTSLAGMSSPTPAHTVNPESEQSTEPEQSTGDPRVDEQLAVLDLLSERPVSEHVPILENAHRALSDILATIDSTGGDSTGIDAAGGPASGPRG